MSAERPFTRPTQDHDKSRRGGPRKSPSLLMYKLALARASREGDGRAAVTSDTPFTVYASPQASDDVAAAWAGLRTVTLDPALLDRNLVITAGRSDPAHISFDVLRAKIVQPLAERGWKRVGITSPSRGCGKSFVSVNLAISLSRYKAFRTVLMDMDLRLPTVARTLGLTDLSSMGEFLRGHVGVEDFVRRVGPNPLNIGPSLALGLNGRGESFAAELFHEATTAESLARLDATLAPDIMLFDLPPVLAVDDVIALKPHVDCLLIVAGAGLTTPRELREMSQRLGEDTPILGVVLNKGEGEDLSGYGT